MRLKGQDLNEQWLLEIWSAADADLNRALNYVFDSPPDKVMKGTSIPTTNDTKPNPPSNGTTKGNEVIQVPTAMATWNQNESASRVKISGNAPQAVVAFPIGPDMTESTRKRPDHTDNISTIQSDSTSLRKVSSDDHSVDQERNWLLDKQMERLVDLKTEIDCVIAFPDSLRSPVSMRRLRDKIECALAVPNITISLAEREREVSRNNEVMSVLKTHIQKLVSDAVINGEKGVLIHLKKEVAKLRKTMKMQLVNERVARHPSTILLSETLPYELLSGHGNRNCLKGVDNKISSPNHDDQRSSDSESSISDISRLSVSRRRGDTNRDTAEWYHEDVECRKSPLSGGGLEDRTIIEANERNTNPFLEPECLPPSDREDFTELSTREVDASKIRNDRRSRRNHKIKKLEERQRYIENFLGGASWNK